ncbi:hypothetical protein P879_00237 [Paragonimus westermani]|uniref:ADF-H domain-containing protein n=1 Tax=Paragonimus westermani TaxID=34504 RepID=A0A8T0DZP7_9TREM|nr:hypothetical protein P879_00237 [Paragonimus westermani]
MASGIKANDHCFEVYNDIKRKRKYLYAIFKIVAPDIVVDKTSDPAPGISGSHLVFTSCEKSEDEVMGRNFGYTG